MNEIITREFINKNIKYVDCIPTDGPDEDNYNYDVLSKKIDAFKNLLQQHGADSSSAKSALIGISPGLDQTACVFACFELAITVCIVDYGRGDEFRHYTYMDPKTELLSPIDFFIVKKNRKSFDAKNEFFINHCEKSIYIEDAEDYTPNNAQFCTPDSVIMKCTSSGTTGTPKVVEHTHKFLYHLAIRNTMFYDSVCAILYNLNHGSSFATYFLPVLHNKQTTKVYNISCRPSKFCNGEVSVIKKFLSKIDHIMISYMIEIENLLSRSSNNINIYTLSSIPQRWKKYYKRNMNDVISFFGSNETSGPVLINKLSFNNFSSDQYFAIDDFYKIEINNETLHVPLPYYDNITIDTKDKFTRIDDKTYKFLGRSDLIKINGNTIKKTVYNSIVLSNGVKDFDLIYDIHENLIYLAIWQDVPDVGKKANRIIDKIKLISNNRNTINKYAVLDKSEFLTGVKIDHELLRHYFRKYVKDSN
jgi:hypothetical protein